MAYYITGDCHAHFDKLIWLARFNKKLGKEDVIILLGDVGLNYFGADKDRENKKLLADFPNYFLCVHGNHEERPYHIQTYRTKIWRGGEVYYVRRHIVGGANRTLFSVDLPPRLCRTGT